MEIMQLFLSNSYVCHRNHLAELIGLIQNSSALGLLILIWLKQKMLEKIHQPVIPSITNDDQIKNDVIRFLWFSSVRIFSAPDGQCSRNKPVGIFH